MASILIENMDEALHGRLQASAAAHSRSIAEEARELLREAVWRQGPLEHLVELATRLFGSEHGFDLDIPPRNAAPAHTPPDYDSPDFDEPDDPSPAAR